MFLFQLKYSFWMKCKANFVCLHFSPKLLLKKSIKIRSFLTWRHSKNISLQLSLRSNHSAIFLKQGRPKKQPSICIFQYRYSALVLKFFGNTTDGVRYLVNLHITLSNFEQLLRKLKYLITALISAEQLLL